jgi:hypothetical protein
MMKNTFGSRALLGAALSLVLVAACGYSPNPENGTLKCGSSNTCPEGFSCRSGTCWKDSGTAGTTVGGGSMGTGGTGGSNSLSKFIGTWTFVAQQSTRTRSCSDGTQETTTPWDDFFDVTAGSVAALSADYYCNWNLDVNGGGTATAIRSGSMCTKADPTMVGTSYTWRGESFTLTTTDGTSGMLEASLPYSYTTPLGSGSCQMHFNGPVTKQ